MEEAARSRRDGQSGSFKAQRAELPFDNPLGDANAVDPNTGRVTDPGAFMRINSVQDLAREGIDERQFRLGLRIRF